MKHSLLLIFALLLGWNIQAQVPNGTITYKNYLSLPAYSLFDLNNKPLLTTSVPQKGKSLVIVYFSPSCGHCQEFTSNLTARLKDFKKVQFLYVSAYPLADIQKFTTDRGLQKMTNFTIAHDPEFKLGTFFAMKELPSVFVYGSNGKLKGNFDSKLTIDELVLMANE
ncbi:MAG TPA: redoxin domain-containing protein [Phnomibacter sp.]|nr:redoxin domain-containing protein [Phnomibacter sp.]